MQTGSHKYGMIQLIIMGILCILGSVLIIINLFTGTVPWYYFIISWGLILGFSATIPMSRGILISTLPLTFCSLLIFIILAGIFNVPFEMNALKNLMFGMRGLSVGYFILFYFCWWALSTLFYIFVIFRKPHKPTTVSL